MKYKVWYLIVPLFLFFINCGKKEYFGDYLPISVGSRWIFEDGQGQVAEIEVTDDSLSSYRDTIFNVFFLGDNIEFMKTPNTVSWHFIKKTLIEDREVYLEDRFYPFFEMPFIDGKTGHTEYENRDTESGAYFKRIYDYTLSMESDYVKVDITTNTIYVYNNDTTNKVSLYTFYLAPDTGFVKIIYTFDGKTHNLLLKEYNKGEE